jgi:glycosyltransferase involved in cell wall biosynthesis
MKTNQQKKVTSQKPKVVVVMPAYNAEKTLKKTLDDIPKNLAYKIILVDDGSHDKTVTKAKALGIQTFV